MRAALVVGAGGHARAVLSLLISSRLYKPIGVVDMSPSSAMGYVMGIPVLQIGPLESIVEFNDHDIFLAVGDNAKRGELWVRLSELGLSMPNLISPKAYVDPSAVLGDANIICPFAFVGPEAKLGSNNLINTGSIVEHEVVLGSNCHLAPSSTVAGRTRIGDYSFLGAGSTVINNLYVAENSIIGAGAALVQNITTPNGVYIGVPAKIKGWSQ